MSGIKAVQTLSRLNRAHPQKHDAFVLDFMNDVDTIQEAFADYYRTTVLSEETDPNKLHDLKAALDGYQVYADAEIDQLVTRCLRCLLLVMCTYPFAKKALTLYLARSEGHDRYFGCNLMQCKVLASSHQHLIAEAPERALAILRRSVRSTDFVGLPRTSLVSIRDSSRDYGYTQPERAPGGRAVPGRTLRPQDHTDL